MRTRNLIVLAIGTCAAVGLLGAYSVATEPIAYIASMTYSIFSMFLIIPLAVLLLIAAIVAAILQKTKYAVAFFLSCLMLPTFFIGGFQAMRALGLVRYETNGSNEMRPLDDEPNGNVIVVYTKESTFEEQEKLSNEIIHPWKEGPGFTGETGVQASIGLLDMEGRIAQKILFRRSATEAEKEKLRMGLMASPIVYRYFENLTEGEVRYKLEQSNTNKKL